MKVAGIIAEFNPFHCGHKYLIEKCRQKLGADKIVVVMSGDFVQRGAPAIVDKFTRTRMALECGADLVIELPVYYSLGSAEFFAEGAVAILEGLGCIDYLCFGAEDPEIKDSETIIDILIKEPKEYKDALAQSLKTGKSFAAARAHALSEVIGADSMHGALSALRGDNLIADMDLSERLLSSPNNILAIEYLKALKRRNSKIKPYTVQRIGAGYHSLESVDVMSASGVRDRILSKDSSTIKKRAFDILNGLVPDEVISLVSDYRGIFLDSDDFSSLLHYKLLCEKQKGYAYYHDLSTDLSNRIINSLEGYECFTSFTQLLKPKNMTYTRISRSLFHILLNITDEHMLTYKSDNFTCYARVLGMKASSSDLLSMIRLTASIPVIERLKTAYKLLSPLQMQLLDETLTSGSIYNAVAQNGITSEYRLMPVIT